MQTRRWNFRDDDATKDINRWLTGIIMPGLYLGFDFNPTANLNLNLNHNTTGFKDVNDLEAESNFLAVIVTRAGTIIKEDAAITINGVAAGHATLPRIDIVVVTHTYDEVAGGSQALYSIITGTPNATPVAPALANAYTQIKIGELYIPATTTLLNQAGVKWTRSGRPGFGNTTFAIAEPNDLNDIKSTGFYVTGGSPTLNRPVAANGGIIHNAFSADNGFQIYITQSTNLLYFRNKSAGTWGSWIPVDGIGSITGAITTVLTSNLTANRAVVSNGSGKLVVSTTTDTQIGYLSTSTSDIQTQINSKQATITGAITTVLTSNLTANRAVVSDGSGKIVSSSITITELGYLTNLSGDLQASLDGKQALSSASTAELNFLVGTSSNIQTQLNGKQATITGGATTILSSNLTASRILVSDVSGKVVVSSFGSSELTYMSQAVIGNEISPGAGDVNNLIGDFLSNKFSQIEFTTGGSSNAPTASGTDFFMIMAGTTGVGTHFQIAFTMDGANPGKIWARKFATGAWTAWASVNT